jgi:hypothetical protein
MNATINSATLMQKRVQIGYLDAPRSDASPKSRARSVSKVLILDAGNLAKVR